MKNLTFLLMAIWGFGNRWLAKIVMLSKFQVPCRLTMHKYCKRSAMCWFIDMRINCLLPRCSMFRKPQRQWVHQWRRRRSGLPQHRLSCDQSLYRYSAWCSVFGIVYLSHGVVFAGKQLCWKLQRGRMSRMRLFSQCYQKWDILRWIFLNFLKLKCSN